jgi:hypothetical protein
MAVAQCMAIEGTFHSRDPLLRQGGARPEVERREGGRVNSLPHVNNDHWYGHDRPNDRRYVIGHPYEHGRFEHFGPSYRYGIERFDRDHHRFWFPGGFSFEIASRDWPLAEDWCWDLWRRQFRGLRRPRSSWLVYDLQLADWRLHSRPVHGFVSRTPRS